MNHPESAGLHVAPFSPAPLPFIRQNREAHRAHQAHLVDLFSHVNFHFVSAGFPCVLALGRWAVCHISKKACHKRQVGEG
jgi:hypothetical protein